LQASYTVSTADKRFDQFVEYSGNPCILDKIYCTYVITQTMIINM